MKPILTLIALTLFFSLHTFSQERNHAVVLPEKFISKNLQKIYKSNADGLKEFKTNDSRTTVIKTQFGNGFLLIEEFFQTWSGSAWVNYMKYSYIYDGNNNQTEELVQQWSGSAWSNAAKTSYIYVPVTAVNGDFNSVNSYSLTQYYPNPFNSSSMIKHPIPKSSQVSLKIFNMLGEEIETLVDEEKPIGTYELNWNATNLPSGVHFYQLKAGDFVEAKKMMLLK